MAKAGGLNYLGEVLKVGGLLLILAWAEPWGLGVREAGADPGLTRDVNDYVNPAGNLFPGEWYLLEALEVQEGNGGPPQGAVQLDERVMLPVESSSRWINELVGFNVQGRKSWQRLRIEDMDALINDEGQRLLPILRISRALGVTVQDQGRFIILQGEGVGRVQIDTSGQRVQINEQDERPLLMQQFQSEITFKADVYLPVEAMEDILDLELIWDVDLYEYRVLLDRKLKIWERARVGRIQTQFIPDDVPTVLDMAQPETRALQFMEVTWSPYGRVQSSAGDDLQQLSLSLPRETLWGGFQNGRYRMKLSHPHLYCENGDKGVYWANQDGYVARLDLFEWIYQQQRMQWTLGDSTVGLGELVFPGGSVMGVRVNGLHGFTREELLQDRSALGLQQRFNQAHVFEGTAPLGATVDLLVNGQQVERQEVIQEESSSPGFGVYRFEQIELSSALLNKVEIVTTESNGNQARVEKTIVGSPLLLPQGRSAYVGLVGTQRQLPTEGSDLFEVGSFYGNMTGGRWLYGLTDRVSVGVMGGMQQHLFDYENTQGVSGTRDYPDRSEHAGVVLSCQPSDRCLVSSELAFSSGQGQGLYEGLASRTNCEVWPTQQLTTRLNALHITPDFFDGHSPWVGDRQAVEGGLSWKWSRRWSLRAGGGALRDNLESQLAGTTSVDYQSLALQTSAVPRMTLRAQLNRFNANLADGEALIGELEARIRPRKYTDITLAWIHGTPMTDQITSSFWRGLRLDYIPQEIQPAYYVGLRQMMGGNSSLSLSYRDSEVERQWSLRHSTRLAGEHPLRLNSELRHESPDSGDSELSFRGSADYLLDPTGQNRISLTGLCYDDHYSVTLGLTLKGLFARHRNKMHNITARRIRPAYGAVQGVVFLDRNDNCIPDANEPGIAGVKVSINGARSCFTDEQGYYILSYSGSGPEAYIHLDTQTVPAIYSVVHGMQVARVQSGRMTEVNLSVTPMISLTGVIILQQEGRPDRPVAGIMVCLEDPETGRLAANSVTGSKGGYYLADLQPGEYVLRLDPKTVPSRYQVDELERSVTVRPAQEEFMEVELSPLILRLDHPKDL